MVSLRPACFLALGTTLGERVYAIQEEKGRPEAEIKSTTQQKADATSTTSLPEIFASRLVSCPAIFSLARRDRAAALGRSARADKTTWQSNAEGYSRRESRRAGKRDCSARSGLASLALEQTGGADL